MKFGFAVSWCITDIVGWIGDGKFYLRTSVVKQSLVETYLKAEPTLFSYTESKTRLPQTYNSYCEKVVLVYSCKLINYSSKIKVILEQYNESNIGLISAVMLSQ